MVQIYSKYKRPDVNMESGGGKSLVEKGSHVPVMQQVRDMISAGERLGNTRAGAYDFDPGTEIPEEVIPDATRSSNFDLADATRALEKARETMKEVSDGIPIQPSGEAPAIEGDKKDTQ